MGSGIGFVRDAQNLAKQNRSNLKDKRNFQKTYKLKGKAKELKFKDASPEEVAAFKVKFIRRKRAEHLRKAVLLALTLISCGLFFWFLFN